MARAEDVEPAADDEDPPPDLDLPAAGEDEEGLAFLFSTVGRAMALRLKASRSRSSAESICGWWETLDMIKVGNVSNSHRLRLAYLGDFGGKLD